MQQKSIGEKGWFCSNCLDHPFRDVTNESLISLFEENKRVMSHIYLKKFNPVCSICMRKLVKPLRSIPWYCCCYLVHGKYSKLKTV